MGEKGCKRMEKLSKEFLGLAGEYAVGSELCKRGVYAQLTMGHHKRTDILVETERSMLRIQVKSKQGRVWPAIGGIRGEDEFLVLVDFEGKEVGERPDFYVLDVADWKALIKNEKHRFSGVAIDDRLHITYPDGWKGLNIDPSQVSECRETWEKLADQDSGREGCVASRP